MLYRFTGGADGAAPASGLIFDKAGNLYGTTTLGGNLNITQCTNGFTIHGCGVVFELSPQQGGTWTETPIYTFGGVTDGAYPAGNLVFDALGNLYGTAEIGGGGVACDTDGLIGCGTVFELSPGGSGTWTETTLYAFQDAPDGSEPYAGMVFDQAGNLYGTSLFGGSGGNGTVFELAAPTDGSGVWTESILYSFTGVGQPQAGVIFDQAGNLFGATGQGSFGVSDTVFELKPSTGGMWNLSTIYTFGSGRTNQPLGTLLTDTSGNLYGTAAGKYCGGVYRLENKNDTWNEAELDFFTGTKGPCGPEGGLTFGKWGAAYGTSYQGGTGTVCGDRGCGTVFGILP